MADKKQQRELYVLIALLVVGALIWYAYFGKKPVVTGTSFDAKYTPINAQDFGELIKELNDAQKTEYKSNGKNIFVASAAPPPQAVVAPKKVEVSRRIGPMPPPPPPPPPPANLPMKFFGYANTPSSGPRQAFLQEGDEVHIVSEGQVVLNHIRILHIGNDSIEFEDTNTHQKGSNPMEAAPNATAAAGAPNA